MKLSIHPALIVLFIISLLVMLYLSLHPYEYAIDWEVITEGAFQPHKVWGMDNGLVEHKIMTDKLVLSEYFVGGKIKSQTAWVSFFAMLMWMAFCFILASTSYLGRLVFFLVIGLLALFINRLSLEEINFFGVSNPFIPWVIFLVLAAPLIYFKEYQQRTPFWLRFLILILISTVLVLGVSEKELFVHHFITHSLFNFMICGLLFLFVVAEEPIFMVLYFITNQKEAKHNHIHFIILTLIYLINLTLYYFNKSGYIPNSFFFFDPFILLGLTVLFGVWSLKFKFTTLFEPTTGNAWLKTTFGLGFLFFCFLSLAMYQGMDGIYEGFHYFILYFHLGMGLFFVIYVLINFIDPLVLGLPIYRVVYKERNFPYFSARLAGLMTVLGLFAVSGQEGYQLIRSGYYNHLAEYATVQGNELLGQEYFDQAAFLGRKTHYPNYSQGWNHWSGGKESVAKDFFEDALHRFGSPYAYINYGILDKSMNYEKVKVLLEASLRASKNGEIENNLGFLHMEKHHFEKALFYFKKAKPHKNWAAVPLINKWKVYNKTGDYDLSEVELDFQRAHIGVQANILGALSTFSDSLPVFIGKKVPHAPPLYRQAYLLNSAHIFLEDTLQVWIKNEIELATNRRYRMYLQFALAVHHYKRGEVNAAFQILDNLQANARADFRGKYLDALGKLALQQGAYQLSLDYFNQALQHGYDESNFPCLEALACLGRRQDIINRLIKITEKKPELTTQANEFLNRLASYTLPQKQPTQITLDEQSIEEIKRIASQNAFDEHLILKAVSILKDKNDISRYDILLKSIEINPYSVLLLETYILTALEINVSDYAEEALIKLSTLSEKSHFQQFLARYTRLKSKSLDDTFTR